MTRLQWLVAASAVAMAACSGTGGTGAITGSLTVAGEKRADVSVDLLGPVTRGAVTDSNGAFTFNGLPDGDFVVRATVPGTREGTRVASVTIKGGKSSAAATLTFTTEAPVTISGHVVFSDGSDASGVVVTATGTETKIATTATDGAFSFTGMKPGGYVISASVADTREQSITVGANATDDLDVGNLKFTPSGSIPGIVTYNGAPVAAAQVVVTGTSLSSVSGDQGQFEFTGVPTGAQTILARVGTEPFFRSASAAVTVVRGENPSVSLALSDAPLPTGTVKGKITFEVGAKSPTGITISVAGLPITATPTALGEFSFDLPIGTHVLKATAPHYPLQTIGTVTVTANDTQWLPATTLSFFTTVFTNPTNLVYVNQVVWNDDSRASNKQLVWMCDDYVVYGGEGGGDCLSNSLRLLDLATSELTPIFYGEFDDPTLSPSGDLVVWRADETVWTFTVATRVLKAYPLADESSSAFNRAHFGTNDSTISINGNTYYWARNSSGAGGSNAFSFSADGSLLMYARQLYFERNVNENYSYGYGWRVSRINLATSAIDSTPGAALVPGGLELRFPANITYVGGQQWTYATDELDGGSTLSQFGVAGESTVFSGSTSFSASAPVFGVSPLEDGGSQLAVLPPGAPAAVVVPGFASDSTVTALLLGSPKYPLAPISSPLADGGVQASVLLITAATGASIDLGANVATGQLTNPSGTQMLFGTQAPLDDGGSVFTVLQLALPPTGAPTQIFQSTAPPSIAGWLSDDTLLMIQDPQNPDAGAVVTTITNGTSTTSESLPGTFPDFYSGQSVALQLTANGWKAFAGSRQQTLAVPASVHAWLGCAPQATASNPTGFAIGLDDGQQGFASVNAMGVLTAHPLSSYGECSLAGNDMIALGNSSVDGPSYSALFYFSSGDTVFWRGGDYTGEPYFVGYEGGKLGVLNTSNDGHKLGFALFNR